MHRLVLAVLVSYLLGAVPFAWLLGKLKGIDIRRVGSGNIGATNLTRSAGRVWGLAAFALDFLKGCVPALVAPWLTAAPEVGPGRAEPSAMPLVAAIACGAAAILGHVYPIYLRFRGGKGVATSFGVMTALVPLAAAAAAAAWGLVYLASRTVSIASLAAAAAFPPAAGLLSGGRQGAELWARVGLATAVSALVVFRHRANIQRLLAGKENRF